MTDQLWRAVLTLLAAAGAVFIAFRLFQAVMPALLVVAVLLLVLRLASGAVGRGDRW